MISLEKRAAKRKKWDFEADVVVVGDGGAGTCAAIAAHDVGLKALILEKAPFGGGNTTCSGGGMAIPTDVAKATEYYRALTKGGVDAEWIPAFAEAMVGLTRRLEAWGAELKYAKESPTYPTFPGADAFNQLTRIDYASRETVAYEWIGQSSGNQLFNFLDNQTKKRGIKVMFETPAKELIQEPITKEILGLRAESSTGEIYVKARRSVVLTCGGFQNNKEILQNFLAFTAELPIYPLGTPYNTGDGIYIWLRKQEPSSGI